MLYCGLLTVGLVYTCLVGDRALGSVRSALWRAVADSCTHGLVALFSWAIVALGSRRGTGSLVVSRRFEILLCGILGSAIDLDHFAAACSLDLTSALSLDRRPLLHSTGLCFFIQAVFFLVSLIRGIGWLSRLGWIFCAAFLSHHVRDATRRGIWLWGSVSSPPIPYFAYLSILVLLPHVILRLIAVTDHYFVPLSRSSFLYSSDISEV